MTPTDNRFHELRQLLHAYEEPGYAFDDTWEAPGKALSAYLRVVTGNPERAAAVAGEIEDLLTVGLFSDEIADDVDLLPHIDPPPRGSVEDCLRVVHHHLKRFLDAPPPASTARPTLAWEWRERLPALRHFLTAYFHQDFELEYQSHAEAVDDYLVGVERDDLLDVVSEIEQFSALNPSDTELQEAATSLGLREPPPRGVPLRQWLRDVQGIVKQHFRSQR